MTIKTAPTTARQAWLDQGALPLPVAPDGTKRPAVKAWKQFQNPANRPTPEELGRLWRADSDGIGILCGAASGGIEMLELEGAAVKEGLPPQLQATFTEHGQGALWQELMSGYMEITPSGGIHWYYRVQGEPLGNTKLASRPTTPEERETHPGQKIRVLIETRGEGGWSVVAPSAGRSHPTGKAWMAVPGRTPADIITITATERDTIHDLCRLLDQPPVEGTPAPAAPAPVAAPAATVGLRPGDDFNDRASWRDILEPHGWRIDHEAGGTTYWIRPGKKKGEGVSATTGHSDDGQDRLYVFSTSTDLEAEVPYSKLGAYAALNHGGDHSAAASALRNQGYGDQGEPDAPLPTLTLIRPDAEKQTSSAIDNAREVGETLARISEPTEDAAAEAFVMLYAGRVRYCPQRKQWLVWDGARWVWDETEKHRHQIRLLARQIPAGDGWKAFRTKALTASGVTGIARLAQADPRVVIHIDELDARPWELNTPAGAIDLRTGELLPPDPEALHTRTTTVPPDPQQETPVWNAFLEATFGGDEELISFMQRLLGVALVGQVVEQRLPFLFGAGANGKSTLMEAVMSVVGRGAEGYSIAGDAAMLTAQARQEHPSQIAQLAGARLVVLPELEDGTRFAEARVKQLTGSDSIAARFMHRDWFTFTPSHTLFLVANHKPQATVGGLAFWRRLLLLDFPHVVPEAERDPELPARLVAEYPGILAWLARGASDYAQHGLMVPASVDAATQTYRSDEDTIGKFVADSCHLAPGGGVLVQAKVGEVRDAYERMCRELGDTPVNARRLTQELRDRWGVDSVKGANGVRFYRGLTLLSHDTEPESPFGDSPVPLRGVR